MFHLTKSVISRSVAFAYYLASSRVIKTTARPNVASQESARVREKEKMRESTSRNSFFVFLLVSMSDTMWDKRAYVSRVIYLSDYHHGIASQLLHCHDVWQFYTTPMSFALSLSLPPLPSVSLSLSSPTILLSYSHRAKEIDATPIISDEFRNSITFWLSRYFASKLHRTGWHEIR